ncbi:prolyl 4-hydroxylase 6 [Apiospora arundinis]|uniref:Prolyl 4-hydroxylase 6 n=1 Tax=Apiospora arundinis TaxID=335852 RepID=A0ABR2IFM9_9PEZI
MSESIYRLRFSVWAAALAILALSAPWAFDHLITPDATATITKPLLGPWYHHKAFVASLFANSSPPLSTPPKSDGQGEEEGASPFVCDPHHAYTMTIISLDPLLLYITSFLSPPEIAALLAAGEPDFAPSYVVKNGQRIGTPDRTSQSAGLSRDDPAVRCVLARAQAFLGPALFDGGGGDGGDGGRDDIGPPQLVRYEEGQRFNIHHDWYETPQPPARGEMDAWRGSGWNRIASFFAILEDECEGGETWFPHVEPPTTIPSIINGEHNELPIWRIHEEGGVAFRPVAGNALFWVNLHANGTGDRRTLHAGLPVEDGLKTAMNIWPRKYYK